MTEHIKKYGLIGETLTYSFSKDYFSKKFEKEGIQDSQYELYELKRIEDFCSLIDENDFSGLNVTIPYKEVVIPYLDEIDHDALEIGAVNTISFDGSQLKGYNTDIIGFKSSLLDLIGERKIDRALVLGTGGASKAIQFVLKKEGIRPTVVSRSTGNLQYKNIDKKVMTEHHLIVNCTPLGTFPNVDECPEILYRHVSHKHLFYDLVYNPEKSLFLKSGEQGGAKIMNGLPMLIGQAEGAWKIWNNQ